VPDARCVAPRAIVRLDTKEGATELARDPEAPSNWRLSDGSQLRVGARTYALDDADGTLIARQGSTEIWRAPCHPIAGGALDLATSPNGAVIARRYSRGGVELFDGASGRLVATASREVEVSPDERTLLDPPAIGFATGRFETADVRKIDVARGVAKKVITLPLPVGREVDDNPSFGVAFCATSALYAVSFPTTEIAVFRAEDDVKLATLAKPGPGRPVFSRSGHLLVTRDPNDSVTVFRLLP
jgi:hypothetical protein